MIVPPNVKLARHPIDLNDDGHQYVELVVTTEGDTSLVLAPNGTGGVEWVTGATTPDDITDIPTAETDTSLVLAPDGAGGVEWVTPATITEITDIPTAETDTALVLVPDGAGGVEWGPTSGTGRWELAVLTGSPPDPLYADGDFLYIFVP